MGLRIWAWELRMGDQDLGLELSLRLSSEIGIGIENCDWVLGIGN